MRVKLGIDRLLTVEYKRLKGKALGVIANQTSQNIFPSAHHRRALGSSRTAVDRLVRAGARRAG